jgi:hypothetical protein
MPASKNLSQWIAANGGTGVNFGKTSYIAQITGEHAKYNLDRNFISYKLDSSYSGKTGTKAVDADDIEVGGVYEIRGDSWGNRHQKFVQVVRKDVTEDGVELETVTIDGGDDEVIAHVRAEKTAAPSPRSLDDDAEPAITVVCEHCGGSFASHRGVAIHQSLAECGQSDDEQTDDRDAAEANADAGQTVAADGGLEIRSYDELRHSDGLVRDYRTPPGDRLYAYRTADGQHHVVVSRGSEPATRWERRIPATVARPVPGQRRWSVPDNWEQRVVSSRGDHSAGLYYVPESDVWARVNIPTNNWLQDAWYVVEAVGELAVNPVGELGDRRDVRQLADEMEENEHTYDAAALRDVARNWDEVEADLTMACDWVRGEGFDQLQSGDEAVHADRSWQIEFNRERVFRPGEAISRAVDLSQHDIPDGVLLDILRDAGLLPSHYRFELSLDETAVDMEYHVRGLVAAGASAAEALDYHMVENIGLTQTAWADERGVTQSTVSGNVSAAKQCLE